MTQLLQLALGGLALGVVYALLALGFVVVYRASNVVNFAHPSLVMVGAYLTARLAISDTVPFGVAVGAGIVGAAFVAYLMQLLVRIMAGKSVIAVSIMTLGAGLIIDTAIIQLLGVDGLLAMRDPWGNRVVHLGPLTVPQTRLAALAVGVVLIVGFFVWFRYSIWGIAMRAVAEDSATAALMGIRRGTIAAMAWMLAGLLAAIAGLFLTVSPQAGLAPATAAAALRAFPAAIIGGLDSTTGAIVGGVVVGLAEVLTQGYASQFSLFGQGFYTVMPYVVMVAVLLVRPSGLFGTKELHRV